ncbi:MAG TPA: VOC family protein [Methylomirabilota bacterium]|nr:VOC family protein [Methylomirabilota bacterium]
MTRFQFDCIFYHVRDVEKAISFYSDVLGFRLTSRDVVARFDIDGVLFELVPTQGGRDLGGKGNARLCLKVEDISQAVEYLKVKGIHAEQIQEVGNGKLTSIQDPDGNEISLWQYD